jgi:hypothetical protein
MAAPPNGTLTAFGDQYLPPGDCLVYQRTARLVGYRCGAPRRIADFLSVQICRPAMAMASRYGTQTAARLDIAAN